MIRPRLSALNRCGITRRRPFSTTLSQAEPSQNAPCPPEAGYARLTNRGLISITGLDSATFLQGLITQNMLVGKPPNKTVRHTGSYAAFLNSQGRILNDAFIYPLSNADGNVEWLVEVDKNEVVTLLKHLKKHKLRAKLKLRAIDDGERTVWSSWKSHSQPRWEEYSMDSESVPPFAATSDVTGCIDSRTPGFGSRIVTPGSEDLRSHFLDETQLAGSEVGLDSYTVRRILNGVAEGQGEIIRESALPLEYNMDMGRAIDFRKGCYVGQELTIRTHHTGIVRKRVLPVQFYTDTLDLTEGPAYDPSAQLSLPPSGSNIMKAGASRGRSAGKVLSSVGNIGLALCRLEMMTDVALTGEATQYNPENEFKVSWATETEKSEVKLQAFVPPWTRDFIYNGGVRKQAPQPIDADGKRARVLVEHLDGEEQLRKH